MNGFNSFDKTDTEYSPAPTDVLVRFWRSRSQQAVCMCWQRHRCWCWGIEVHLLVFSSVTVDLVLWCCWFGCCRRHRTSKSCFTGLFKRDRA